MAPGNTVTLVGNVTRDPELRFTKSGRAVAGFGLAVNRRWFNNHTDEWEEEVDFFDITCWAELGENVASSVQKGDDVGPSLRWAEASITKNEKREKSSGSRSSRSRDDDRGNRRRPERTKRDDYEEEPF